MESPFPPYDSRALISDWLDKQVAASHKAITPLPAADEAAVERIIRESAADEIEFAAALAQFKSEKRSS